MPTILSSQLALEMLTAGKTVRLCAEGGSMRPWLKPGSVVTLEPISCRENLRVGEVVFAIADGRAMLHRVVRLSPQLLTKGDALPCFDPPPQEILGRVVGQSRLGGYLIARASYLFQPLQRALLLLGILLRSAYERRHA